MMREAWSKTVHMHMQQNGYTNRANNNNGGGCPNEIKMSSKEEHAARFLHSFFVLLPFLTFRAAIFHEIDRNHYTFLQFDVTVRTATAMHYLLTLPAQLSRSSTNRIRDTTGRNNNKMQQ